MRVIIAGPRDFYPHYDHVDRVVKESGFEITEVVSGDAEGVDYRGEQWAKKNSIPVKHFPADWKRLGKAAGPVRNGEMAKYADAAILIWTEEPTPGTSNMLAWMVLLRKPHHNEIP